MRKRKQRLPPAALKPPPHSVMKPPPPVRAPKLPPAGGLPNPRRAALTRRTHVDLNDLFTMFPELPWPSRPRVRASVVTLAARLRLARRQPASAATARPVSGERRAR